MTVASLNPSHSLRDEETYCIWRRHQWESAQGAHQCVYAPWGNCWMLSRFSAMRRVLLDDRNTAKWMSVIEQPVGRLGQRYVCKKSNMSQMTLPQQEQIISTDCFLRSCLNQKSESLISAANIYVNWSKTSAQGGTHLSREQFWFCCGFCTFALMNMQSEWHFISVCKTQEKKMQIHSFSTCDVIYQA